MWLRRPGNPLVSNLGRTNWGETRGVIKGDGKQWSAGGCAMATPPSVCRCMQVGEGFSGEELSGWVKGGRERIPHRFARLKAVSHSKRGVKGKEKKKI